MDQGLTRVPVENREDFAIVDETDEYIVVDKPAPLMIHPSKPGDPPTLWCGLRELLRYELVNGGSISIITRLDRETSGLVLVAKTKKAARRFGLAIQRHQIEKTYLAIVHGWPEEDHFTVDAPLVRQGEVMLSEVWVRQCVHPHGSPSVTQFQVLNRWSKRLADGREERFTLLEARPVTGRMHQIRVHVKHAGFPILGDKLYGIDGDAYLECLATGWTPALAERLLLPRQALHAAKLAVNMDGERKEWLSALPQDLRKFRDDALLSPPPCSAWICP